MQVDPIKPRLKAPGTRRLKLQYDELLSTFAFKFDLRRYTKGSGDKEKGTNVESPRTKHHHHHTGSKTGPGDAMWRGCTPVHFSAQLERFLWDRGCA